jgi:AcrR family transcriptional regulator
MVAKVRPTGQVRARARLDRRRAILDAATGLFAERGFAGVSVQDVADAARTHKTTVLYHYASKEALYDAVLDEALVRMSGVMREFLAGGFESEGLRERVAYLLDQIQAHFAEHPAHARLLQRELLEVATPSQYVSHFVEQIYLPAVAGLEQAAAQGIIRPVDPALFIHDMHVQLIGYFCHQRLLERLKPGDPLSIEALIARRNHLVDQIFCQLEPYGGALAIS